MAIENKKKPELVSLTHTSFHDIFNSSYFEKYFNLSLFEENKVYKNDVIFVYNHAVKISTLLKYSDTHKMICDLCWESTQCNLYWQQWIDSLPNIQNHLILTNIDKFFWFNEKNRTIKNRTDINFNIKNKKFFMPIRRQNKNRDLLFDKINLYNSIHSYVERGIVLEEKFVDDRLYKSEWYNQTQYSVVCETYQNCIFVTEKTFKPIMHGHPFILFAGNGQLDCIKQWGFESYDCVFDESYDKSYSIDHKIKIICNNIKDIEYTPEIKRRLVHNQEYFYNSDLPNKEIYSNIVVPVMEYING